MKHALRLALVATIMVLPVAGEAQPANTRGALLAKRNASAKQNLAYGSDALQTLDYWAGSSRNAPLVVFVHGGGWKRGDKQMMDGSAKLSHWQELGYAVASLNYRLLPDNSVEDQAADVAAALSTLFDKAPQLGFDRRKLALTGHSAGAHLVALVGTDPQYLRAAGLSFADLAGVIPIDGAAYDVPRQLRGRQPLMGKTYIQAFGTDPKRQLALSPTHHANAPNVTNFLIIYVGRKDGVEQAEELASALKRGGSRVESQQFDGKGLRGHRDINRSLGDPDYPATPVVDAFLRRVFG